MKYVFMIISAVCILSGAAIAIGNWAGVYKAAVKKEKTGSWIPLIGGILLLIGLLLFPHDLTKKLCWIGLIADWGCIPGIVYSVAAVLRRK